MVTELPVLWACWGSSEPDYEGHRQQVCEWLVANGLDPNRLSGIEVVLLDAPCLRLHEFALDDRGNRYGQPDESGQWSVVMAEPRLHPMKSWPPSYETQDPGGEAPLAAHS